MYHQYISRKTSPMFKQTPVHRQSPPASQRYAPLSDVIQRAQKDPSLISAAEEYHLHKAIGSRATLKILAGQKTDWFPKFEGISARIERETQQAEAAQAKKKDDAEISPIELETKNLSTQPNVNLTQENTPIQKKETKSEVRSENKTGLPDKLKAGVENLSGYSLDNVRVHYNSPKPAQLQAHAYTQGTDIHVAPRQEKHLPHETWHVVQQMQGRVKPTIQMKGVKINDNEELENEANSMGANTWQMKQAKNTVAKKLILLPGIVQRMENSDEEESIEDSLYELSTEEERLSAEDSLYELSTEEERLPAEEIYHLKNKSYRSSRRFYNNQRRNTRENLIKRQKSTGGRLHSGFKGLGEVIKLDAKGREIRIHKKKGTKNRQPDIDHMIDWVALDKAVDDLSSEMSSADKETFKDFVYNVEDNLVILSHNVHTSKKTTTRDNIPSRIENNAKKLVKEQRKKFKNDSFGQKERLKKRKRLAKKKHLLLKKHKK